MCPQPFTVSTCPLSRYDVELQRLREMTHEVFAEQRDLPPILALLKVVPGS
jgi:hypothetical protein